MKCKILTFLENNIEHLSELEEIKSKSLTIMKKIDFYYIKL